MEAIHLAHIPATNTEPDRIKVSSEGRSKIYSTHGLPQYKDLGAYGCAVYQFCEEFFPDLFPFRAYKATFPKPKDKVYGYECVYIIDATYNFEEFV